MRAAAHGSAQRLPLALLCAAACLAAHGATQTPLRVVPAVWREGAMPGELRLQVGADHAARDVRAYTVDRNGEPQQVWQQKMSPGSAVPLPRAVFARAGFYRFVSTDSAAGTPSSATASVVAAPTARTVGAPLFGMNTHFAQREIPDVAYELLRLANVEVIRDQWTWDAVEKTRGQLRLPTAPGGGPERQRERLLGAGLKLLQDCAYTNALYDGGRFPSSSEAIEAFARYCAYVASSFGTALYGTEIWNESNAEDPVKAYAPLVATTAQSLRRVTPAAAILQGGGAGAGGGADPFYEESVFKSVGRGCCTGFSVHPYMTNPDVGYFAAQSRLIDVTTHQSIVNMDFVTYWSDYVSHETGLERGSNITEIGWSTAAGGPDGVSEEKQAAFIARTLILSTKPSACTRGSASAPGVAQPPCTPKPGAVITDLASLFIYDFIDDGTNGADREQNFGLLHADLTPKMSFAAYAEAAGILRGCRFSRSLSFGDRSMANALLCATGADSGWLVLWTAELKPKGIVTSAADLRDARTARTRTTVTLDGETASPREAGQVDCREWDGRPCVLARDGIVISNLPVYVRVRGGLDRIAVTEAPPL